MQLPKGEKLPSLKVLRKSQHKLNKISLKRNKRKRGSKPRRKLANGSTSLTVSPERSRRAKREGKQHQKIARSRKDFHYKTAHKLVRSLKRVFFHEKLNLQGLGKRNKPKQDEIGKFLPNGQSAKSGLNKSFLDAAFGQFFNILNHIAAKAGAVVVSQNPAYTSQLLSYRNEIIFTNLNARRYWDDKELFWVDRDINAAINLKKLGLGIFPSIKRRSGKIVIEGSMTDSTMKEILNIFNRTSEAYIETVLRSM